MALGLAYRRHDTSAISGDPRPPRIMWPLVLSPEIWSGKLIEKFYAATVLSAISNTDYEGEIKSYG